MCFLQCWALCANVPLVMFDQSTSKFSASLIRSEAEGAQHHAITLPTKLDVTPPSVWWALCVFLVFPSPSVLCACPSRDTSV